MNVMKRNNDEKDNTYIILNDNVHELNAEFSEIGEGDIKIYIWNTDLTDIHVSTGDLELLYRKENNMYAIVYIPLFNNGRLIC